MNPSISWYASNYIDRFGMKLVPVEPLKKFPLAKDWGHNVLGEAITAELFYDQNPTWNMGVALGPSNLCSLDIDCMDSFAVICETFGIAIDELIAETPTIQGNPAKGCRLMFRVPAGVSLPYQKLNWRRNDGTGKSYTVFELRSATDGEQRQDIVPPSIHPETGKPYQWLTNPRQDWPTPPAWMLAMWGDWERFKPQLVDMCPWAEEKVQAVHRPSPIQRQEGQVSVIDSYIDANDLQSELSRYGYKKVGKRYLSPHSTTGLPGVLIFPEGRSCWINHASDPLCSEDSGRPVNAFDLFCYYECNGDASAAVKKAAELLGMKSEPMAKRQQAVEQYVEDEPEEFNEQDYEFEPPRHPDDEVQSPAIQDKPVARFSRAEYNLAEILPFCNDKGKPLNHIANVGEICKRIGAVIRYNVIRKEEEILIPHHSFSIDNEANASFAWLKSECSLFNMGTDSLGEYITYLADKNLYNPVAEWVGSKPWDGVSRVQEWCDTVTGAQDHVPRKKWLKETLMRRWAISAVAAAHSPDGISAAGVLTIQGEQYLGKTKWFKQLAPEAMNVVKDGMILRPDDKDSVKQICSFWLVELGELDATFRKSDMAALKSFLTNKTDVLRRAYARRESQFARRTVFFASVNPKEFLHDPTGNRRYWTIEATKLDHSHTIDMQQFWSEILAMWKGGEGFYLLQDEMSELNAHNESYTAIDPVEDRIMSALSWGDEQIEWRWATATDILRDVGFDRPNQSEASRAAACLRKHNGGQGRRSNGKALLLAPKRLLSEYP
jgi:hypothetical protein